MFFPLTLSQPVLVQISYFPRASLLPSSLHLDMVPLPRSTLDLQRLLLRSYVAQYSGPRYPILHLHLKRT